MIIYSVVVWNVDKTFTKENTQQQNILHNDRANTGRMERKRMKREEGGREREDTRERAKYLKNFTRHAAWGESGSDLLGEGGICDPLRGTMAGKEGKNHNLKDLLWKMDMLHTKLQT